MKVILLQTVPKVGKAGPVVEVATGFARNYLFRRSLAIVADKRQIAALEKRNAHLAAKSAGVVADAEALKTKLDGQTVRIPAQVGAAQGKLFGAITAQAIADAVNSQLGASIERRQVGLVESIKKLGEFPITIDLHRDVDAHITVHVFDPHVESVEAAAI
jgi:large subunit ribosomal protein L9